MLLVVPPPPQKKKKNIFTWRTQQKAQQMYAFAQVLFLNLQFFSIANTQFMKQFTTFSQL